MRMTICQPLSKIMKKKYKSKFKLSRCVPILLKYPKFNFSQSENIMSSEELDSNINHFGNGQAGDLVRPLGVKNAKEIYKAKIGFDSNNDPIAHLKVMPIITQFVKVLNNEYNACSIYRINETTNIKLIAPLSFKK